VEKQLVHEVVESFEEDVNIDALFDRLYVLEKIRQGEKDFEEGRYLTQEEVRKRFSKWLA
jgi:predicted transcriptional regulator